jgi:hypothetical protein
LSFWAWLPSLNMMSSNCIHLPSNHIILYGWVNSIVFSCRAPGLFP